MNKRIFLPISCLVMIGASPLDAKLELKELGIGKKIYKEAIVEREGAETIVISHEGGKARIPVSKLPKEIASQMGIDESLLSSGQDEEEVFKLKELTVKNKTYEGVTLKKVNEYEASLSHEGGKARVPLKDFPAEWRHKLGYDEKLAQAEGQKLLKERKEAELVIFEAAQRLKQEAKQEREDSEKDGISEESPWRPSSGGRGEERIFAHYYSTESAVRASWKYPDLCFSSTDMYKQAKSLGTKAPREFFDDHNWPEKLAELAFERTSPSPRSRPGEYNDWKNRPKSEYHVKYVYSCLCGDIVRERNKKSKK